MASNHYQAHSLLLEIEGGEELESDDSISNLWNVFSRERAPNIVHG